MPRPLRRRPAGGASCGARHAIHTVTGAVVGWDIGLRHPVQLLPLPSAARRSHRALYPWAGRGSGDQAADAGQVQCPDRRAVRPVHQESLRSRTALTAVQCPGLGRHRPADRAHPVAGGNGTVLATVLGVWLGVRSAWKRGERFDKVATTTTLVLYSMPEFWFGMILLIVFSVGVLGMPGSFPSAGCPHRASTPPRSPELLTSHGISYCRSSLSPSSISPNTP